MKIHEFQAKQLFRKYQVPTPSGGLALDSEKAKQIASEIGHFPVVVKAQIHAGGRGKGGGVQLAHSLDEVSQHAEAIIGMNLVTHQTGPEGKVVKQVLVEEGVNIDKELYLSLIPDRETACILVIASEAGGMDIEEVAETSPEKIIKVHINPLSGIQPFHCRKVSFGLNLPTPINKEFTQMLTRLYQLFIETDCSLVEINPLVITKENKVLALDAKMDFDDNALFRHKDLLEFRDLEEEDPLDVEASKFNLNYINLDGTVGNMVNGAGLAMAVMDTIKLAGAEPANFLDVGGGATAEMVENGFKIILSDDKVKAILINIFGGILRCDVLAKGVVEAARNTEINVPLVVRMEGTNVKEGRRILADSGLDLFTANDMKSAGEIVAKIVAS
ncbi:MAG: ADP-forming succinate--CoA ligase subunit beta [Desulfobacteraceae bacterium]|nr:ADP-forming succinate--CoA ligase subunit beta [Desulfobacteraceae bacterium]MBC2757054.1 ADP-forming succinate--CoA ligase subunit beta [Desulfobacteraceae bacterium]